MEVSTTTPTPNTDHQRTTMLPSIVFLSILSLVGLIGNSLILFVYFRKFPRTSTNVFIVAIACFDLIINVFIIPGELISILHHWDTSPRVFCKVLMYFSAFTFILSAMSLVAVAVARFTQSFKEVKKTMTIRDARFLCLVIIAAALVFATPYAIVNGHHKKILDSIDVSECGVDDAFAADSIWPLANASFLIVLFLTCCLPLLVLYLLICCKVWNRSMSEGRAKVNAAERNNTGDDPRGSLPVVSPRSRSYIKKKPGHSGQTSDDTGQSGDKLGAPNRLDEKGEDNVIEYLDESKEDAREGGIYQARMIRAPTGEKVTVNLSMVRELTVKLKAVQKQVQERQAKESDQETDNGDQVDHSLKEDAFINNNNGKPEKIIPTTKQSTNEEPVQSQSDMKENKDDSKDHQNDLKDLQENHQKDLQDGHQKGLQGDLQSKSVTEDANETDKKFISQSNLNDNQNMSQEQTNNQNLEQNQNDDFTDKNQDEKTSESSKSETGEIEKQQPEKLNLDIPVESAKESENKPDPSSPLPSDFAKAMQWVDITYCQQPDHKVSEADEEGCGDSSVGLMKKGSFMSSRKVSRDNSFLRKHRKLRDALTDTLTRARKTKKDRDDKNGSCIDISDKNNDRISEDVNDTENVDDSLNAVETDATVFNKNETHAADSSVALGDNKQTEIPQNDDSQGSGNDDDGLDKRGLGATTWMLLIASLIFIIVSLPYLALNFTISKSPSAFSSATDTGKSMYNVFIRAHLLNSAVKPIIYTICNAKFRRHCGRIHKHS
ncbi:muscarinic acetylcholine receptor gar-3 [Biomphalaria glabrata]|nr:muscarinic acetylcholine receptor gar-3 [Biomphalaria glabrata]